MASEFSTDTAAGAARPVMYWLLGIALFWVLWLTLFTGVGGDGVGIGGATS